MEASFFPSVIVLEGAVEAAGEGGGAVINSLIQL